MLSQAPVSNRENQGPPTRPPAAWGTPTRPWHHERHEHTRVQRTAEPWSSARTTVLVLRRRKLRHRLSWLHHLPRSGSPKPRAEIRRAVHTGRQETPALHVHTGWPLQAVTPRALFPCLSDGRTKPRISKGHFPYPTRLTSALPVWFENWTEFTASISNPKTCKTDREGPDVRELWACNDVQQVPNPGLGPAWKRGAMHARPPGAGTRRLSPSRAPGARFGWCLCQVMGFVHSFILEVSWEATSLKG